MKEYTNAIMTLAALQAKLSCDLAVAVYERDRTEGHIRLCEDANRHLHDDLQRQTEENALVEIKVRSELRVYIAEIEGQRDEIGEKLEKLRDLYLKECRAHEETRALLTSARRERDQLKARVVDLEKTSWVSVEAAPIAVEVSEPKPESPPVTSVHPTVKIARRYGLSYGRWTADYTPDEAIHVIDLLAQGVERARVASQLGLSRDRVTSVAANQAARVTELKALKGVDRDEYLSNILKVFKYRQGL